MLIAGHRARLFRVVGPFVLVLACAGGVLAECLNPRPACEELARSHVAFEGEVLMVEVKQGTGVMTVRFRVIHPVKGAKPGAWSASFPLTPNEHTFRQGERVIVYARRDGDVWTTSCNRTRAFSEREQRLLDEERAALEGCSAPKSRR